MKRILLGFFLSGLSYSGAYSQITNKPVFKIISIGSQYSASQLETAMLNADWCGMINPETNYIIKFEDGSKLEMLSQKNLLQEEIEIDNSCVRSTDEEETATYKIAENGYIIRLVSKNTHGKFTVKN